MAQPADACGAGLVVIHDLMGLQSDMERILARFADAGYVALAPDLFDRRGPKALCVSRTLLAMQRGTGTTFELIDAARDWLGERPDVEFDRLGVIGFCMGGGFAILAAADGRYAVCAPFYGVVPSDQKAIEDICPVVGGFGERDPTFAAMGRRLESHLTALGVPHDIAFYPDAGHAFMNHHEGQLAGFGKFTPLRAGYNEDAAEDSWTRMLSFFEPYLRPTGTGTP